LQNHDFNRGILDVVDHRRWPIPDAPWIMTQTWHDLLFAHWRVDTVALAAKLPPSLELDLFDGESWIGVVPFHMTNVAPRGVPSLPWVSAFPELNVRTYVRVAGKPGVYFFSLDAGSALAVAVARAWFHLPYFRASIQVEERDDGVRYRSRRLATSGRNAELIASYRPTGPAFHPREGTLEYFLAERYCLYTVDDAFNALRLEIHHAPWLLQAAEAVFEENTMADAAGIYLPSQAPVLHFAKRQDAVAWPLARVERPSGSGRASTQA
jgi:uncharacterized protein YqjF (DUF2071 family)